MNAPNADLIAGAGMLLFTGAEALMDSPQIFEILSKFGIIAVLWFWLKDLKNQMKDQLKAFDKETDEIRSTYDKILNQRVSEHNDYKNRIDQQLIDKDKMILELQSKILNNNNK